MKYGLKEVQSKCRHSKVSFARNCFLSPGNEASRQVGKSFHKIPEVGPLCRKQ